MKEKEITQQEYDEQIAWLSTFAAEQRELRTLRRLIAEYPAEAHALIRIRKGEQ